MDYTVPNHQASLLRQKQDGKIVQIYVVRGLVVHREGNGDFRMYDNVPVGKVRPKLGPILDLLLPPEPRVSRGTANVYVDEGSEFPVVALFDPTKPIEYVYCPAKIKRAEAPKTGGSDVEQRVVVVHPWEKRYIALYDVLTKLDARSRDESGRAYNTYLKEKTDYSHPNAHGSLLRQQHDGKTVEIYVEDQIIVYKGEGGARACYGSCRPGLGTCLYLLRPPEDDGSSQASTCPASAPEKTVPGSPLRTPEKGGSR